MPGRHIKVMYAPHIVNLSTKKNCKFSIWLIVFSMGKVTLPATAAEMESNPGPFMI
jgi:hypothetical protein